MEVGRTRAFASGGRAGYYEGILSVMAFSNDI